MLQGKSPLEVYHHYSVPTILQAVMRIVFWKKLFYYRFAEDKLHSAIWKQTFIALIGIIFAEDKLHSAIRKQAFIALIGIIFAFG